MKITETLGLGKFPKTRLRRNRGADFTRRLISENCLSSNDLIWPIFVQDGVNVRKPVSSMPGVNRLSIDQLTDAVGYAAELKIPAVAVFPYVDPSLKTPTAIEAYNPENIVCRAIREIKAFYPEIGVICDVALDPYNSEGHDGLVKNGVIINDETVEVLCKQALVLAEAGCDIIAPSDMMDGRIGIIRQGLDEKGFESVLILAYAAKYASAFYGPFRDAVGSGNSLKGDKKTYQMDPANSDEALRETAMDIGEGADMVMVKPGLAYLDIIYRVKTAFGVPTIAYQVSGEYAMIKAAVKNGWLDNDTITIECLIALKRAGADAIFTYMALEAARLLND